MLQSLYLHCAPVRLRSKLILMAVLMVTIPILTIGYVVETEGRAALLQEKQNKLFAVTHFLDTLLGDDFSLYQQMPRAERIQVLNQRLSSRTEQIAASFPGIGTGYYHRQLDAIITYAPKNAYQSNVGLSISADHPGRLVMASQKSQVVWGHQVRGNIMNVMSPVVRNGEVIGYIWANELAEKISQQALAMDLRMIVVLAIGLLISICLIIVFSRRLSSDIEVIKHGLAALPHNLDAQLPTLTGEMGDITASVNTLARALRETRTLNDLIIENAADGVIAVDTHGLVTLMNPTAETVTGYRQDELLGKPYATMFSTASFHSPILETLEKGTRFVAYEITFPARHRTIELSVTTSQIFNANNELIGALVILSDLTARKEIQRRMAQAERLAALGELMAGVAHEVRNPLTAIKGYAQILRELETDPQHQEYLRIILKEIQSINAVIQQLLDFARPQTGRWQAVNLNQVVNDCLVLIKTKGVEVRIDFVTRMDTSLSDITADGEMLKQVILNILINAVQAISARGKIIIHTRRLNNTHQILRIKDNGCGIPAQIKSKIFDPFYTTKASGTGLGLAISQRIIHVHQGDIHFTSHPNRGTTFTLVLPVNQTQENDNETKLANTDR
ncbi:two-component system sensor histidine kinase AtoS [Buttiauxella noackiae]|uniref:two-component system sensor histidine kinase AtoS n=1 Tax=Buttiauxella noackiae TaxID=82992 RepID=UPI0028D32C56|nr:two-component system sensor histidine kinase AtoS [Buttiauxella noackiae]